MSRLGRLLVVKGVVLSFFLGDSVFLLQPGKRLEKIMIRCDLSINETRNSIQVGQRIVMFFLEREEACLFGF